MIRSSEYYLKSRVSGLRKKFDFEPSGGIPVALAADLSISSSPGALALFKSDLPRYRFSGGVEVVRQKDEAIAVQGSIASSLIDPQVPLADMGISSRVVATVIPLAEHIKAGGAVVSGLAGPGSNAVRIELLAEVDRPQLLFSAAARAGHGASATLEEALMHLVMPGATGSLKGVQPVALHHLTRNTVTDWMRLQATRSELTGKPADRMEFAV